MDANRKRVIAWLGREVIPHEGSVRLWLRRSRVSAEDIDDLIQEAYCKLISIDSVDHIPRPDSYFFQTVRNLLYDKMRRARVVRIDAITELEALTVYADEPSPEQATAAKRELALVQRLIKNLPEKCRRIIELRKIQGVPQREIAQRLGISETMVENEAVKGMRLIMRALRDEGLGEQDERVRSYDERARDRRRH